MASYFVTYRSKNGDIIGPSTINLEYIDALRHSQGVADILATTGIDDTNKEKSKEDHKQRVAWALVNMKVERILTLKLTGKLKEINTFCEAIGELSNRYDLELDLR